MTRESTRGTATIAAHAMIAAAVWMLAACAEDSVPPDAGRLDAGRHDTGMDAAQMASDAGDDASAPSDAALRDAGARDAGIDAAIADAGASSDAAMDGGRVSMPCTASGACDPFDLGSCAAGQRCAVTDTGTECQDFAADPPHAEGETCGLDRECDRGLWCVSFGGDFTCERMCPAGSIGACGADAACNGSVGAETCVQICRPLPARCDIFTQDCADPGDACTLATNPETLERYTGCRPNGTVSEGDPCGGSLGACMRGLICIRASDGTTACRAVCGGSDGGAPPCEAGQACTGLARSWSIPYCEPAP